MSLILALLLASPLPAQQVDDPEAEYREQYVRYGEISQMTEPDAQAEAYLDFLEGGIDDRLLDFVVGGIVKDIQTLTEARNYDPVFTHADRFGDVHPSALLTAQALAFNAAAMAGDSEKIIKYGEPIYKQAPDSESAPQIALLLTQAYGQLNNEAKMIEYGQITLDSGAFPLEDVWNIHYTILRDHVQNDRDAEAVKMAREFRAGLTSAPDGVSAADWNTIQVYLLDLIGRSDFEGKRFREALSSFDAILAIDGKSDKAWFLKGNAMLQTGASPDAASVALAKSVVLEGNYSAQARDLLEKTAATNAPPGTAAVNQYVQQKLTQARRELGM